MCHRVPEASSPAHRPGAGSAGLTSRAEVTLSRSRGSGQARPEADGGSAVASVSFSASDQTREGLGWAPDLAARSHSPSNSNASFPREATLQSPRVYCSIMFSRNKGCLVLRGACGDELSGCAGTPPPRRGFLWAAGVTAQEACGPTVATPGH